MMRKAIKKYADIYDVPAELIEAIIEVESSGNPYAIRYEPGYKWLYKPNKIADLHPVTRATEKHMQRTSWGLMQIMGAVAREHGFSGSYLSELTQTDVNIKYGTKHLRQYYDIHGKWSDAIASYNAGSPRKEDGEYINQEYVDRVMRLWKE